MMNRRQFGLTAMAAATQARGAAARPNFLFLMADQMRADALGVSGNLFSKTPTLDALAREGVRFENAYCAQALCTPSRGALLTGVYPHTSHLDGNLYNVPSAFRDKRYTLAPNWPALLRRAGYYTGFIGKWHLGETDPGLFDQYQGYNSLKPHWVGEKYKSEYRSDLETQQAIEFLEKNGSKPFMLFVSYYPPHTPYDPPKQDEEYYRAKGVDHSGYWGGVTAVDRAIGRVLGKVKELGLERDTFVSFTADHGETFGLRMGSTNKTVCYEESAKVPLIVRWPAGAPGGLIFEGGVTNMDLMPTILEAAGLPVPSRVQATSRLGEMRNRDLAWKEPVFLENITQNDIEGRPAVERAVRTEEWKLILRDHPQDELYHLETDRNEKRNRIQESEQKSRIRAMSESLMRWGERMDDPVAMQLAKRYIPS